MVQKLIHGNTNMYFLSLPSILIVFHGSDLSRKSYCFNMKYSMKRMFYGGSLLKINLVQFLTYVGLTSIIKRTMEKYY